MRILIPVLGFSASGGYRVLSKLADEWIRLGHQVCFTSFDEYGPVKFETSARVVWFDREGRFVPAPEHVARGKIRLPKLILLLTSAIRRLKGEFDVVLANHSYTPYGALLAGAKDKLYYYVQAYEPEFYWLEGGAKGKAGALISWMSYNLIDRSRIIVNSPLYLEYKNIRSDAVVPPGIDLRNFCPKEDPGGIRLIPAIGFISRKEAFKGDRQCIDAYRRLRAMGIRCRLKIAYGNTRPEELAGLPDVEIVIPGNDAELADYYRSLDILLALATIQLGATHYPVMEAMACGTVVVTTGYAPADQTCALLVGPDDSAVAAAVARAIDDPDASRALAQRAIARVQDYSWNNVAVRMPFIREAFHPMAAIQGR
jgi:glycosyltransferase involved in cell wall biosynthesis